MHALLAVAVVACGIEFQIPHGWRAHVTHPKPDVCAVGVSPRNWPELLAKARWPEDEAVRIDVITGHLAVAEKDAGFFHYQGSGLWAIDGQAWHPVEKARYGGMSGWQARGMYRSFAKEGVDLRGMDHLISGEYYAVLLQRTSRSWIVVKYFDNNPDFPDPVPAGDRVLRTLRRR